MLFTWAIINVDIITEVICVIPSSGSNVTTKRLPLKTWRAIFGIASIFHGSVSGVKENAALRVHSIKRCILSHSPKTKEDLL